jgi:hypothetical protein
LPRTTFDELLAPSRLDEADPIARMSFDESGPQAKAQEAHHQHDGDRLKQGHERGNNSDYLILGYVLTHTVAI